MNKVGKTGQQNRMAGNHPSYKEKGMSEESRQNKIAYDKKYQKKKSKYRAVLNKKNRDAGTYGNGDGMDMSHYKNGEIHKENQSANRSRNGHDKKSTKK